MLRLTPYSTLSVLATGWLTACAPSIPVRSSAARIEPTRLVLREAPTVEPGNQTPNVSVREGPEVPNRLDWPMIRRLALEHHPRLQAIVLEAEALEFERQTADRLPNPVVGLEVEDFAGQGDRSGLRGAQETLWVSQTFEAGGKRAARVRIAEAHQTMQQLEGEVARQMILGQARQAYLSTLVAQQALALATELEGLMDGFYTTLQGRVEAGKVSALDQSQYAVSMSGARLDRQRAERAVRLASQQLAQCWGGEAEGLVVVGDWPEPTPLPDLDGLRTRLERTVRMQLARQAQHLASAELEAARAGRHSDWEWTVGLRRYEDSDDFAATVGVQAPWRLHSSGKQREAAARAREARSEFEALDRKRHDWTQITTLHGEASAALEAFASIQGPLLEQAEWVYRSTLEGYQQGRFDLVQVLAAQASYFDLRARKAEALADYHGALTRLNTLLGETWE
ncbi:MAG: TolC family protein [Planctomycetes bacterium]|nr:TolC family protein [Planctomycetota bacterium]MCB9913214.1 TolC family protein [Planctomycetota bacterium]HPF15421.1 TolC family protein [Planctomycetota bacterium]